MFVQEIEPTRRLLVRVERGDSIMAVLRKLARDHAITDAWIQGTGAFEWAEVAAHELGRGALGPSRRFDTRCDVPSLLGKLSTPAGDPLLELKVVLSRESDNGVEVLGGHLVAARVLFLDLRVECFDRLGHEEDGGQEADDAEETEPTPSGSGVSWAMAAEVSSRATEVATPTRQVARPRSGDLPPAHVPEPLPERGRGEPEVLEDLAIQLGDWVDHQSFGLCRVDRVDDDDGLLIKLPNGRRKLIKITFLDVLSPRDEGGRRVFPLRAKKGTRG